MSREIPASHKPYPELVELHAHPTPYWIVDTVGKPWLPTNGMTSLRDRKLLVPLVAGARSVTRHEQGHVKWSPHDVPAVPYDQRYLMAVEDARVNLGLARVGAEVLLTPEEIEKVVALAREDLSERNLLAFILRAVAAQGTNAERALLEALARLPAAARLLATTATDRVRSELLRERRALHAPVAPFFVTERLAAELARELEPALARLGFPRALPFPLQLAGAGCCLGPGGSSHGSLSGRRRGGSDDSAGGPRDCPAGEMRIVNAALVHPSPAPRGGWKRGRSRATDEGTLPRNLHRWVLDRAVFRRSVRVRGGTVLVDTSGSMSLDAAGVDRILAVSCGAAKVAIYSGHEGVGELRIVARDGRRADGKDLVPFGRGNIVDEPALRWLARQERPLLWISDGGVTGVGDVTSAGLQRRCQEIVAQARIRRVRTVDEAVACLAGSCVTESRAGSRPHGVP